VFDEACLNQIKKTKHGFPCDQWQLPVNYWWRLAMGCPIDP
jgi:hypothetical protein